MNSPLRPIAPGSTKQSVPAEEIVGALAVLGEDDPSAERVEQLQLQLGADGLPPDSPSEAIVKAVAAAQQFASARQTLSHYADGDRVSDLYDSDDEFADALRTVTGPGFEYPDFSWMTVGQARRHAERSRSETMPVDAPNPDPRLRVVLLNNRGESVWQMHSEDPQEALSAFVRLTKRQFGDEHGIGSHIALVDRNSELDAAKVYEGRKTYILKFGNDQARDAFYEAEARASKLPPEIGAEYRCDEPGFDGIVKVTAVYGDRVFFEGDADGSATIAEFHKAYAPAGIDELRLAVSGTSDLNVSEGAPVQASSKQVGGELTEDQDEACRAARVIAALQATGKVTVRHSSSPGDDPGFYARHKRADGSEGMLISFSATEADAWLSAAIKLAQYKPGELQMTSREFGTTWTANVLCKDGSLGTLQKRSRLEIRKLGDQYEAFVLTRRYLRGEDPLDVRQQQQGGPFATLADAEGYVRQYIKDYEGAAADDHIAAVEAERERVREGSIAFALDAQRETDRAEGSVDSTGHGNDTERESSEKAEMPATVLRGILDDARELKQMKVEINGDYSPEDLAAWDARLANAEQVISELPDMTKRPDLSALENHTLIDELRRRGLVLSAWSADDVTSVLENDEDAGRLTDDQFAELEGRLFEEASTALEDLLASRGNDHVSAIWDLRKSQILRAVSRVEADAPSPDM
ncbi:hypothetical protein [Burkholderia vietnamiensis]|uniref:hypothetical protein n=1 Tax=Burkholderia vietnamiensis TaxID=60552 RepID=UPI001CF231CE|nr:hypothetical protein [Burkholderia vietnamiensis]MCA8198474.1 hypothetical protein [Burkholderia vietnamiensis]